MKNKYFIYVICVLVFLCVVTTVISITPKKKKTEDQAKEEFQKNIKCTKNLSPFNILTFSYTTDKNNTLVTKSDFYIRGTDENTNSLIDTQNQSVQTREDCKEIVEGTYKCSEASDTIETITKNSYELTSTFNLTNENIKEAVETLKQNGFNCEKN